MPINDLEDFLQKRPAINKSAFSRVVGISRQYVTMLLNGKRPLTVETIAKLKLGVSRQTINTIENDKYGPSLSLAFKNSRLFKKPVETIFEDGVG